MAEFYDLTHGFDEDTYHPFGFASFRNIQMFASHGCRHAIVTMSLHFGTHMDAPWHMTEKGRRLDAIRELIDEGVVVDLQAGLSSHGLELRKGDALVVYAGWAPARGRVRVRRAHEAARREDRSLSPGGISLPEGACPPRAPRRESP